MAKSLIALLLTLALMPSTARADDPQPLESAAAGADNAAEEKGDAVAARVAAETVTRYQLQQAYRNIAGKVLPAIVEIRVHVGRRYYLTFENKDEYGGYGAGFIVDAEKGLIVTNAHVVDEVGRNGILQKPYREKDGVNFVQVDRAEITVTLANGDKVPAKVVDFDEHKDLALVQLDRTPKQIAELHLQAAVLGDDKNLKVGDLIAAIGSPLKYRNSSTFGHISALGRKNHPEGHGDAIDDYIQFDASSNPGNSGGALANAEGAAIGIPSSIVSMSESQGSIGLGLAIPIHHVREMLDLYQTEGRVHTTRIGLNWETAPWGGLSITKVAPGTPVWESQQIVEGDVIIAVDGISLTAGQTSEFGPSADDYAKSFENYIKEKKPGDTVRLTLLRPDGQNKTVEVKLY